MHDLVCCQVMGNDVARSNGGAMGSFDTHGMQGMVTDST